MSEKWRGKDSIQISTPQAKSSLYIILISLLDHREMAADLPPNWCRTIILTEQIWRDVMVDSSSDSWILDGTSRQNSLPPLEMFCKYENKIWTIYTQLTTDLILHCELNRSTAHWLTYLTDGICATGVVSIQPRKTQAETWGPSSRPLPLFRNIMKRVNH